MKAKRLINFRRLKETRDRTADVLGDPKLGKISAKDIFWEQLVKFEYKLWIRLYQY